jgi:hypothetical protein
MATDRCIYFICTVENSILLITYLHTLKNYILILVLFLLHSLPYAVACPKEQEDFGYRKLHCLPVLASCLC